MEYLGTLVTLAGVFVLGLASPGPNFIIVTSIAVSVSRRAGVMAALGLAAASLTWTLLSILGIGLIITQVGWIYTGVRVIGAAYLVWLGVQMIRRRKVGLGAGYELSSASAWDAMRKAYIVSLTNPKSAAFFGSIFAVMLPLDAPVWVYATVAAMAALLSALWHCSLALFFSNRRVQIAYDRIRTVVNGALGAILIALGAELLLGKR